QKENGLFITLEETPEEIKRDALQFGWDFGKYEKDGKCSIEFFDPFELGDIASRLKDLIVVNNYKRVVIDSTSLFGMYINDTYKVRKKLYKLVQSLKTSGCTALLSSEIPEKSDTLSRFGVEEYVVDGVIILYYTGMENGVCRSLAIRKLRLTNYANGTFPFRITDEGIKILKDDI
ncbi:MAG: ATPase domain-containing protein, partial [archaeon]